MKDGGDLSPPSYKEFWELFGCGEEQQSLLLSILARHIVAFIRKYKSAIETQITSYRQTMWYAEQVQYLEEE